MQAKAASKAGAKKARYVLDLTTAVNDNVIKASSFVDFLNQKIKVDGKEELHDSPKTKNEAEIRNLIQYILSR